MPLKTTILQVRLAVNMVPHWHHTSGDVGRQALACATAAALPAGSSSLRRAISASRSWRGQKLHQNTKSPNISKTCGKPWTCSCAFRAASSSFRAASSSLKAASLSWKHTNNSSPWVRQIAMTTPLYSNCSLAQKTKNMFLVCSWRNIKWPTNRHKSGK